MKYLLGILLVVCAASANADVFKCVVNGKTVFSDQPCAGTAEKLDIKPALEQESGAPATSRRDLEKAKNAYEARALAAIARGEIFIGMAKKDVKSSWGDPDRVNSDNYGGRAREQWIYRRANHAMQYVYLENGVVSAFQDRP